MKKLLLLLFLLTGIVIVGKAQKMANSKDSEAVEKAKILQKLIKLNDDQTAKISAIYQDAYAKFDEIKVKERGNTDKMLVAARPLIGETHAKIKRVLQPKQAADYDKLIKKDSMNGNGGTWDPNGGNSYY